MLTSLPLTQLSRAPHPCSGLLVPCSPGARMGWGCPRLEEVGQGRAAGTLTVLLSPCRSDGRRTLRWGNPQASCIPGGGACGADQGGPWRGAGWGRMGKSSSPPATHSVFWDLYCAAPDRREACEHSNEAKAFQDYVSPCPRDRDQGSWAWASFGACGLGGLCGLRLAWVGRWAWCWGLIWDLGHFWGVPMPSTQSRVTHGVGEAPSIAPSP